MISYHLWTIWYGPNHSTDKGLDIYDKLSLWTVFKNDLKWPENIIPRLNKSLRYLEHPYSTLRLVFTSTAEGHLRSFELTNN